MQTGLQQHTRAELTSAKNTLCDYVHRLEPHCDSTLWHNKSTARRLLVCRHPSMQCRHCWMRNALTAQSPRMKGYAMPCYEAWRCKSCHNQAMLTYTQAHYHPTQRRHSAAITPHAIVAAGASARAAARNARLQSRYSCWLGVYAGATSTHTRGVRGVPVEGISLGDKMSSTKPWPHTLRYIAWYITRV